MIDLQEEIRRALLATRDDFAEIVGDAVRRELLALGHRDPDRLVGVTEAAEILSLTEKAVRKRVERGKLPARRVGRSVRFRLGDLIALGADSPSANREQPR